MPTTLLNIPTSFSVTYDISAPTLALGRVISYSAMTTSSITLNWTPATDNTSSPDNLLYKVYYSLNSNLTSISTTETNGTLGGSFTGISSGIISGLPENLPGQKYYFNIIVQDQTGNKILYFDSPYAQELDATPPLRSNANIIVSNVSEQSLTLTWNKATDNYSSQATLQYRVYRSPSISFNTVTEVEGGTPVNSYTTDINTITLTNTPEGYNYYNIVVKDEIGNKSTYTAVGQLTDLTPPIVLNPTISIVNRAASDITISWPISNDNLAPTLTYRAYVSQNSSLSSISEILANGTLFNSATMSTSTLGWSYSTSAGSRNWYSISCNSDGTTLLAADLTGFLYTSTNSGTTWVAQTTAGSRYWASTASSADGTKLVAGVASIYGGYVYTSTNSGTTWIERTSTGLTSWESLTSSSDGTKLAATTGGNYGPNNYIYTSTDSGATWVVRTSAGSRGWKDIASSSDGNKLAAVATINFSTNANGYVYTSTNAGATWVEQTSTGQKRWEAIASSSDGTKLAAVVYGGSIYTSTNTGTTWIEQVAAGSRDWTSIASSSDGSTLTATSFNNYIYLSTNSGTTWTAQTAAGLRQWRSIAINTDATKIASAPSNDYLWTLNATNSLQAIATGLDDSTLYYFNVVVSDENNNKSTYSKLSTSTLDITAPNISYTTLAALPVASNSVTLNWTQASDPKTAGTTQTNLQYDIYYSLNPNLTTINDTITNGTYGGTFTGVGTGTITGLTSSTLYRFNIIVRDQSGNKTLYTQLTQATLDITSPVGNPTAVEVFSISSSGLILRWNKATDDFSAQPTLQYAIYRSLNAGDLVDLDHIDAALLSGSTQIVYWSNGQEYRTVEDFTDPTNSIKAYRIIDGLASHTTYYFNIVAKDEAGNRFTYNYASATTTDILYSAPNFIKLRSGIVFDPYGDPSDVGGLSYNDSLNKLRFRNATGSGGVYSVLLDNGQGLSYSTATINSNVTLSATINLVDTTTAHTVTLPPASSSLYIIVKDKTGQAATNNITINTTSGLIDGQVSLVISTNLKSVTIISDGTNYFVI